jgi:solute carrier family 35 protein E1
MVDRAKKEFKTISEKTKQIGEEAREMVDKFKDNLQHYSRREIGIYAALTVALTVTLKNVVVAKSSSKTLDLRKINYILESASAIVAMQKLAPLVELRRKKGIGNGVDFALSPSIVSSDGKTYIRTVKSLKQRPYPTSTTGQVQARPAQVVIDTVAAFYPETEPTVTRSLPASHNAVINTMSPSMRRSLKARRIRVRGGASASFERMKIGGYFAAWYALNVVYNIVNKKVLNVLPAPLIVGSIQFGVGALYCAIVWLLKFRPCPTLTKEGTKAVATVGANHMLGQLATMIALGAGPVSFTHIVKAVEPFFSAMVAGLYFKKWMPPQVYVTLIPVVGGVGYACLKELNFSWLAFAAALSSNLFFALRAVLSKSALQSGASAGTNLTAPNMFGLVTMAAFLISIPVALFQEGSVFLSLWSAAIEQVESETQLIRAIFVSGLFHYLNNEVMYMALGSVHPVTLAVGNTMKRVFILVASVLVFRNPITVQAGIGSAVGVAGVLLYSLTKQHFESLEKK